MDDAWLTIHWSNYNEKKAYNTEYKYFTVSFINISGCFYIKSLKPAYDFLISL